MTKNRDVSAIFSLNQYQLSITLAGDGSGAVHSLPAGINCGTDCLASFDYNTPVTLNAIADFGSAFTGWNGACVSILDQCALTITGSRPGKVPGF